MLRVLRSMEWLVSLGIKDESAKNGDWWETDFILVFLIFGLVFKTAILGWLHYLNPLGFTIWRFWGVSDGFIFGGIAN